MKNYTSPQNIYPKRLGLYQGNYLVVEYYNLQQDKFKKHLIQFDPSIGPDKNLEEMLRNQKHSIFLRKIESKYIKKVLKGQ